ncbi:fimbrial protein [Mesorhizobium sp. BAC0120]|uniref:fimbrial protein n=1 Tax=Mesorhizobium sp. BAC0120 TaxID=3090670 RepID=UPI00298CCB09|nr:fimbrial protein [Mesorhizobium sp. BAC0120]MDW6021815.1 fimbrial protein [Mesorhizobium sp. BAC0120]
MAQSALDNDDEKPLDPALERVRRKLVRFAVVNLGILFLALIVVVGALVYKSLRTPAPPSGAFSEAEIALPAGAKMLGHGFADGRISIDAELADGSRAIFLYDVAAQKMVGRYTVIAK